MITNDQIQTVVNKIVESYNPERIVLFGSYANGNPNENSDLDLLIVKDSDLSNHQLAVQIKRQLVDAKFDMDIIVYKSKDVKEWITAPASFIHQVYKYGRTLYEK
ncbi:MAG: nucleotidyltransferase domain-containing protein [Cytophagales bacterium]